jgi:hypothetical protein
LCVAELARLLQPARHAVRGGVDPVDGGAILSRSALNVWVPSTHRQLLQETL